MEEYVLDGETGTEGFINTPFDLEAILSACPKLYEKWKEHPFFFMVDDFDRVIIVYIKNGLAVEDTAYIFCSCKDEYPVGSFGANFILEKGHCPNCDMSVSHPAVISEPYSGDKS